ncbi:hypothetical protein [Anaplasma phagocytophilum]
MCIPYGDTTLSYELAISEFSRTFPRFVRLFRTWVCEVIPYL